LYKKASKSVIQVECDVKYNKKNGSRLTLCVTLKKLKLVLPHRNQSINRKGAYILGDIHGMDHFCTKLAPPPYNKPRSCVSKIYTPMAMVWFGNV
jgi:hypothetical protein